MRPTLIHINAYTAFKLGELLGGFAAGSREHWNRAEWDRFNDSPRVEVVTISAQTADHDALC